MTQKLDDFFNMEKETTEELQDKKDIIVVDSNLPVLDESVDQAIIELIEVGQHGKDMDDLAEKSMSAYEEIKEFAENSEEKNYAQIMSVAVQMQRNAIDAKNSKMRARQKAAELLLKKKKQDEDAELKDAEVVDAEYEQGEDGEILADRNTVLNMIRNEE